ncbi:MAG: caspase family protein [Elusimicrobia bacterium]|nr:caspase family protein [Elusimicrobiota bacterium]
MKSPVFVLLSLATALPFLSGCVSADPSHARSIGVSPSALTFGVIWMGGRGYGDDSLATGIASRSGLTVVPLESEAAADRVDVIVRLTTKNSVIETFSARTRKPLTTGHASFWSYPGLHRDVANHLTAEFAPQTELYKRLVAEKEGGKAVPAAAAVASAPPAAPAPVPAPAFESDVEVPSFRLAEDETKFALVVGVENYQTVAKAEHAGRDARAVKAYLKAAGYPERNIIFLVDQQAGKSALEKYLDAWLPRNTDERSTVLFYFSGHGAPDAEKGEAYLMPWDADAKFTESTGYPVKRLYAKLNALKARRVLVAMDACFSGAGPRSVIGKGLRPLVSKVDDGGGAAGRVGALTASASDEMTGSDDASGHGLFTYYLLKALNARAGKATLKELFDSLSPKVRDAARRDNRDQTPQLVGDGRATL